MNDVNVNLSEVQEHVLKFGESIQNATQTLNERRQYVNENFPPEMLEEYNKLTQYEEQGINEICEDFEKMKLTNDEDWKELMEAQNNMSKDSLIEYLQKRADTRSNDKVSKNYLNLIEQLEFSKTLNNLKIGINKVKNPSKIRNTVNENFDKTFKKLALSMKDAIKLKFLNPKYLVQALIDSGFTLDDSRLFVYYICLQFKNKQNLTDNAVFVDNLIRDIYKLPDNENPEFLANIQEVISIIKNI